jgi:hypothetical protein
MFELGSLLLQTCLVRLAYVLAAMNIALVPRADVQTTPTCTPVAKVDGVTVWKPEGRPSAIVFRTGMTIDVDGAPTAYHPADRNALNRLAHAGRQGRWWGIVAKNGRPIVQGASDPAPGYHVSMTSLQNPAFAETDPRRYVDASAIPYVALPESIIREAGVRLGDIAVVVNQTNGKVAYAIHADQGPKDRIGEGSLYLANRLRNAPVPDAIGIRKSLVRGIVYVVFPGSGNGRPKSREQIAVAGAKLFEHWGGLARLETCLP